MSKFSVEFVSVYMEDKSPKERVEVALAVLKTLEGKPVPFNLNSLLVKALDCLEELVEKWEDE